jgi:hypothetical protein
MLPHKMWEGCLQWGVGWGEVWDIESKICLNLLKFSLIQNKMLGCYGFFIKKIFCGIIFLNQSMVIG